MPMSTYPVQGGFSTAPISRYCGLVLLLSLSNGLQAAGPGRPDTFEWIELQELDNTLIMSIHFRHPIMYQWHYPQSVGSTLLVQMKHIPLRTRPGISRPRPFKPLEYGLIPPNKYIDSVSFEHNDPWSGLLYVQFTRPVAYTVYPAELRKLVLEIDTKKTTFNNTTKTPQP